MNPRGAGNDPSQQVQGHLQVLAGKEQAEVNQTGGGQNRPPLTDP